MGLGYGGFLGLSSAEYRAQLKERTDEELQHQEIAKLRSMMSSAFAVGTGISGAVLTAGGTLILAGLSGRKYRVAGRKRALVQEELTCRGIPLHALELKDFAIPVVASMAGVDPRYWTTC